MPQPDYKTCTADFSPNTGKAPFR